MASTSEAGGADESGPLYRAKASVKVGETFRYTVTYRPQEDDFYSENDPCLWVRIKNMEALPLRAAYFAGPYILYCDIASSDYDQNSPTFSSVEQPTFEPQLKAGQHVHVKLFMNHTSKTEYSWVINVASQIIFSASTEVQFEMVIARSEDQLHHHAHHKPIIPDPLSGLKVLQQDTLDLWHSPTPRNDSPLHLVVLTHGLHSNVGADMQYIKDKIDEAAKKSGENIIVRGYMGNVCKTEKGVKYLGRRVADYVLNDLCSTKDGNIVPQKISFIAHSLGGLTQTFAVAHIQTLDPSFFERVKPVHFICLATPFLGISNENPAYVRMALDFGFVGKTGQDLGLTWKPTPKKKKPLLRILPMGPGHIALKSFKTRTLYGNMVNDGIVPLRTASILYLDWKAISKAQKAKRNEKERNAKADDDPNRNEDVNNADGQENSGSSVGEVPEDSEQKGSDNENDSKKKLSLNNFSINSFFSFMAPQSGGRRPAGIYRRSQTMTGSDGESDEDSGAILPKKSSVFESGVSVLLPPLPSKRFITEPSTRPVTIVHDKVYSEKDLPPRRFHSRPKNLLKRLTRSSTSSAEVPAGANPEDIEKAFASSEKSPISPESSSQTQTPTEDHEIIEKGAQEEKIAREWHREMDWRKVLVVLDPDAHNNIVVRRRFANAYGWPVIDHLVDEHFSAGKSDIPLKSGEKLKGLDIIRGGKSLSNSKLHTLAENTSEDPPEDRDLSSMIRDLDIDGYSSDAETSSKSLPRDHREYLRDNSTAGSSSTTSTGAWESHYNDNDGESENEGVVHQFGNMIDNFRGIIGSVSTGSAGAQLMKLQGSSNEVTGTEDQEIEMDLDRTLDPNVYN